MRRFTVVKSYKRLRSFGVQGPLLRTFYDSVVGSAIFYGIVCWSSSIMDRDRKRMDRVVRRASSDLGCPLDSVEGPLLRTFYDSVVGSAIFYGIVCWSSSITDRDRKRMDRVVRRASSDLGCPLDSVEDTLTALGSSFSEWLLHPRCVKE
ncbi:hypothetical protein D4764_10G0011460, partial [Takifugu flavidus]